MKCVQLVERKRYQNSRQRIKLKNKFEEMKFYKKNRASCDCVTRYTIFFFVSHTDYYYYTILYNAWRQNKWTKYELIHKSNEYYYYYLWTTEYRCVILTNWHSVQWIFILLYKLLSLLPTFVVLQLRHKIELEFIRINTQTQTLAIRNCSWEKKRVCGHSNKKTWATQLNSNNGS